MLPKFLHMVHGMYSMLDLFTNDTNKCIFIIRFVCFSPFLSLCKIVCGCSKILNISYVNSTIKNNEMLRELFMLPSRILVCIVL